MKLHRHWFRHAAECDQALWAEGFPASLEGQWWYHVLEQAQLEDQFEFYYLEIRDSHGDALALAPCFLMEVPLEMFAPEPLLPLLKWIGKGYPPLLHQRTFFVGSPCSDRGWVGLKPHLSHSERRLIFRELAQAFFLQARTLNAPMRVWKDMPESFWPDLKFLEQEFRLFSVVSFPGTEVILPPATESSRKEAYFAQIKPSRRQKLRRTLRRAEAAQTLRIEVVQHPSPALLDQLFKLFWQTYEQASTRFERLNRAFFEAIAKVECCRFIVLYPSESGAGFHPSNPVAFMLVYLDGPVLINKFIGLDYQAPKEWFLYFRLWDACVDLAIQEGHRAIESGQTGYDAKISLGHRMIPLTNFCHHTNPLLRFIYAFVGKQVSWETLDPELKRLADDQDA